MHAETTSLMNSTSAATHAFILNREPSLLSKNRDDDGLSKPPGSQSQVRLSNSDDRWLTAGSAIIRLSKFLSVDHRYFNKIGTEVPDWQPLVAPVRVRNVMCKGDYAATLRYAIHTNAGGRRVIIRDTKIVAVEPSVKDFFSSRGDICRLFYAVYASDVITNLVACASIGESAIQQRYVAGNRIFVPEEINVAPPSYNELVHFINRDYCTKTNTLQLNGSMPDDKRDSSNLQIGDDAQVNPHDQPLSVARMHDLFMGRSTRMNKKDISKKRLNQSSASTDSPLSEEKLRQSFWGAIPKHFSLH